MKKTLLLLIAFFALPGFAKATRKRRGCAAALRYFISARTQAGDT